MVGFSGVCSTLLMNLPNTVDGAVLASLLSIYFDQGPLFASYNGRCRGLSRSPMRVSCAYVLAGSTEESKMLRCADQITRPPAAPR